MLSIKLEIGDLSGVRAVLDDFFLILGRDPELLSQLDGVNLEKSALNLLEAALSVDPLDPDIWWELTSQEGEIQAFCSRIRNLRFHRSKSEYIVLKKDGKIT